MPASSSSWDVIDALTAAVASEDRDLDACERRYDQVGQRLLDAIHRSDRNDLRAGFRRLRRLYEILSGQAPDTYENETSYHLGRIVELTELAGAGIERSTPAEALELLGRPWSKELLRLLASGARKSKELEAELGWETSTLSRRLDAAKNLGLITAPKVGRSRVSRLTLLGQQVLEKLAAAEPTEPAAGDSRPTAEPLTFWLRAVGAR